MLRKLVSVLSAVVLTCGLLPVTAMAEEQAEGTSSLQLEAGTYVEHEAVAYVVGDGSSDGIAAFLRGGSALDDAQTLMEVDAQTVKDVVGEGDGAQSGESLAALSSRSLSMLSESDEGRLVLVRDESKSTEELINELMADDSVVFAEPNYTIDATDDGQDGAAEQSGEETEAQGGFVDAPGLVDDGTDDANGTDGADGTDSVDGTDDADGTDGVDGADDADGTDGVDGDASSQGGASPEDDAQENTETNDSTTSAVNGSTESAANEVADSSAAANSIEFGEDSDDLTQDLSAFQWAYDNDGSLSGVSADEAVDIGYQTWKEAAESSNWSDAASGTGLANVVVAVIDSGVDASNPDLASVMWSDGDNPALRALGGDEHGFSTVEGLSSTEGISDYHGTHVAGSIAAAWDGQGVSGVAPNVQIMSLRHSDTLSSLLACLNYAKTACDEGVNVRVANNSWGLGQCASRSVDLAVTELGERGAASVFGSGNSTADNDAASTLSTTLADNPYVVVVDAIEPSGEVAGYSQFGQTTTDVMAPGSVILSTWATGENNGQGSAEGQKYLGEADSDPVLYESFDGESAFDADVAFEDGTNPAPGKQALSFYAYGSTGAGESVGNTQEGASFEGGVSYAIPYGSEQGSGSLYQSVVTNVTDLSQVADKPRYLSMRYSFRDAIGLQDGQLPYGQVAVAVKLKEDSGYTWAQLAAQGTSGVVDWQGSYYDLGGTAIAVDGSGQQAQIQLTADMIDWDHFQLQMTFVVLSVSTTGGVQTVGQTPVPCTVLLDSVGLGSDVVPYQYEQGTSMATPAVTGAAAIIAGEGRADVKGDAAKPAEKLAALVRGAAQPDERYEGLCSTGGYATVDGAKDPGPAITKVLDEGETVKVQGYFMSEDAHVQLDDMLAQVTSWADLGDGKAELVVAKPDAFAGGQVTVRVTEGDKQSNQRADLGQSTSATYYDQTSLPVPAELSEWGAWQLVGFAGDLYCLPRTTMVESNEDGFEFMLRYDPATQEWARVELPSADALVQAGLASASVVDVTATTFDGDLVAMLSDAGGEGVLFRYTAQGAWEPLGYSTSVSWQTPGFGTLGSDGEALYLFGGVMGDMAQGAVQEYPYIFRLDADAQSMTPIGRLATARIRPQVSYGNGGFVVSGGIGVSMAVQMGGLAGAEMVTWGTDQDGPALLGSSLDLAQFSTQTGQLSYASGAMADGFILAGAANDANTADTYELGLDGSLSAYSKRASEQTLLAPGATAYDSWFYVLAASENDPYRVFSATKVDTAAQPGDYVEPDPEPTPDPDPDPDPDPVDPDPSSPDSDSGKADADGTLKRLASTGDDLPVAPVAALAALAAGCCAVALRGRRGRGEQEARL